jgi:hypothetical protein
MKFTYMSVSRGDWGRAGFTSHAQWVEAFITWADKAVTPDERDHVRAEASYLLACVPSFAPRIAHLTRI